MNNLIAFRKNLRLARTLVMFLVGMFLLVSTACSNQLSAKTPNPTNDDTQSPSTYKLNQT